MGITERYPSQNSCSDCPMYGEWVTLNFGLAFECRVYVLCTPSTPKVELECRAMLMLRQRIDEARREQGCDERRTA